MKKRLTTLVFVAIVLVVSSVLFALYAPATESAPAPQYGGVLRIIRYTGPASPIGWPPEITSATDPAIAMCALESLLSMNRDLSAEPMLATGWKTAPDRRSITFTLRKGIKFHDGTDWNAEAAKFNLEALKAEKRGGTELWTSIRVIDDYTIQVNLSSWENTILEDIGTQLMVSPTAFKTMGIEKVRWNPIGTGAFQFVSHERDVSTKFRRFDGYWQKGKPYLDGIEWKYVTDPMTQEAMMLAGEGDALWSPNLKVGADLRAREFESIHIPDSCWVLMPDTANPNSLFADKRVREAIEYAINKEALLKTLGYGFWQPAYQVAASFLKGYIPDLNARRYNPDKAKALLKDAGYPNGFKTKIFVFPGGPKELLTGIQGYLAEVGIKVDVEFPLMPKFMEYRRKEGWRDAMVGAPWAIYPNLGRTLSIYALSEYVSLRKPAGLKELIKEGLTTAEIEPEKIQKIVRMMFDDAMTVPVWYGGAPRSLRKGVHDTGFLSFSAKDSWSPENTWLSK